jgi:N-acetylneuraminic acid mutarotase
MRRIGVVQILLGAVSMLAAAGTSRPNLDLWRRPGEVNSVAAPRVTAPLSSRDGGPSWQAIEHPFSNDDRLTQGVAWDPVNDQIYMYGGSPDGNIGTDLSQMDRYDPSTDEWTSVAPMATARGWIKGVCCNGYIYAISGFNIAGAEEPSVEEYSIATNSWRYRTSIPTPEIAYSAVVYHDSIIIVMGGTPDSAGNPDTRVQIFNPAANTWLSGTSMNTALDMFDACLVGDTIYIPGGGRDDGDTMFWGAINPANPTQIKWGKYAQTIAGGPRSDDPCVTLSGKVYYCNGAHGFIYDPGTATYDTMPDMPVACYRCCFWCCDGNNGAIYKMAGDDNGDWNQPNNTYYKIQYWLVHYLTCEEMLLGANDDSGSTITPAVDISNLGLNNEHNVGLKLLMDDGNWYTATTTLPLVPSMHDTIAFFKPVTLRQRGYHTCTCIIVLPGWADTTTKTFKVEVRDVGCIGGDSPTVDTVDSDRIEVPIAVVYNYGTEPAGFWTMMKIWSPDHPEIPPYLDVESTYLEAGANANVTFAGLTRWPRGNLIVKCSTMYAQDMNHANDAWTRRYYVRVIDAAALAVLWPRGWVWSGREKPRGLVKNCGTGTEVVPATFNVFNDSGVLIYSSTATETLTSEQVAIYTFTPWDAPPESNYVGQLKVTLHGDMNPANDTTSHVFSAFLGTLDVGVDKIYEPSVTMDTTDFAPSVDVVNYGGLAESFYCYMQIVYLGNNTVVYYDSTPVVNLQPGTDQQSVFPTWTGHIPVGQYKAAAWTFTYADDNPSNDTATVSFTVMTWAVYPWTSEANVPLGDKGKGVKDGAQLAYTAKAGESDSAFIWCLKGNNTNEFFRYNIFTNTWQAADSLPLVSRLVGRARRVRKGSALATGPDGMIYAAKGGGSDEWWQYNPAPDTGNPSWSEKAPVPPGAKSLREGADAVGVSTGGNNYVYLLKGSSTLEFYRYDCTANQWQTLQDAPAGASGKAFKDGSNLAYDPSRNLIYCLKGQYNEFFVYSVDSSKWLDTLPSLPLIGFTGRRRVAKAGTALECMSGKVYCMKGDNTYEVWVYDGGSWSWPVADQYPVGNGKKVNLGGALICAPTVPDAPGGAMFTTKGDNTTEFYEFWPGSDFSAAPSHASDNAEVNKTMPIEARLTATPNPFTGSTRISYSVPKAGPVSIRLYDATGRLVTTVTEGYCNTGSSFTTRFDASPLARGVYLLKFNSEGYNETRKLVLE